MVILKLKVLFVVVFISFFALNSVTAASITDTYVNHKQVLIKKQLNKNMEKNRYTLPTVILGIFTFLLVFFVFYVRMKVSREIKRRQKSKRMGRKYGK